MQRHPGGGLTHRTGLASLSQRGEPVGVAGAGHLRCPPLRCGGAEQPIQVGADHVRANQRQQAAGRHPLVEAAHRDSSVFCPADREAPPVDPAVGTGSAGIPTLLPGVAGLTFQPSQDQSKTAVAVLLGGRAIRDKRFCQQPPPQVGDSQPAGRPPCWHRAGREPLQQRAGGALTGVTGPCQPSSRCRHPIDGRHFCSVPNSTSNDSGR